MISEDIVDLIPLNEHYTLSFEELIKLSGLSQVTLQLLIENGVLTPSDSNKAKDSNLNINTLHFSSQHLVTVRTLSRLQQDFELENNSLSLILLYLKRIQTLETRLKYLDKS